MGSSEVLYFMMFNDKIMMHIVCVCLFRRPAYGVRSTNRFGSKYDYKL